MCLCCVANQISIRSDAIEPLAVGSYGTLYVLSFALISTVATIVDTEVSRVLQKKLDSRGGGRIEDDVLYDSISFLFTTAASLLRLMFASLSGRYIVALFESENNNGFVLLMVVATVILIRRASRAMVG